MVLSINAEQDRRSKLAHLRPITLVTITITDPSSVNYRFSQSTRTYGGNEYLGFLAGISGLLQSITHLDNKPLLDNVIIRLQNRPFGSGTLLDEFLGKTIENAQVKIEQLLLDEAESRDAPTSTGAVTRFLGRVRRISKIQDTDFALECVDERVKLDDLVDWRVVTESDPCPPKEYGKRLPKPYGADARVQCVAWDIGALTTLAEEIDESATGAKKFTDVSRFPSGSFDAMIGAERIGITAKSDANNTLTIGTRGKAGGGSAVIHRPGETIVELQTNNYWVAAEGSDIKGVNEVYMRSPNTGELFKITDFVNTINLADTALIFGRSVASLLIKDTDLETIKQLDNVTQQPAAGSGIQVISFTEDFKLRTVGVGREVFTITGGSLPSATSVGANGDTIESFIVFDKPDTEVTRFRVGFMFQVFNVGAQGSIHEVNVTIVGPSGESESVTKSTGISPAEGASFSGQTAWQTVSNQPKTINDFVNASKSSTGPHLDIRFNYSLNAVIDIEFKSLFVEFDLVGGLTQDAASFAGGFGLELYADVDGYKVPPGDSTYSVSAGTLIERDYDIARHILKRQLATFTALVSNWNTEGAVEQANSEHSFDLRLLGHRLTELLRGLANESRCNITYVGGLWKFLRRRTGTYSTTAPEFSRKNVLVPFDPSVKGLEDIFNTLSAWYAFNPAAQGRDEEQFEGRVEAANSASVTSYGKRELEPFRFLTIQTAAVAQATLDELLQEFKDRRYGVTLSAPHWVAYLLELGDVPTALLPFLSSAIGLRILEIAPNLQDESYSIKGWQVPI